MFAAVRRPSRLPEVWRCIRRIDDWPAIVPAYVGLRSAPLPLKTHTRAGTALDLEEFYDIETLWQIYCREVYDVRPDDRVIIDAGANIGLFACYAAAVAPRAQIHAVEPFPRTFERLRVAVERNGLGGRVTCHPIALSASVGAGTMRAGAAASQMFHLAGPGDVPTAGGVPVRTTTLEAVLDETAVPSIDLLKMDIEGLEYEVLLSAPRGVLRRIRRVNVEFHRAPAGQGDAAALVRHFASAGFSAREHLPALGEYGILHFTKCP